MYERILIPLDGSQEAEAAVHEVVHLSANPTIVHLQLVENGVMQSRQLEGYTLYADQIHDARTRAGEAYVQPLRRMTGRSRSARRGFHHERRLRCMRWPKAAEKLDADLILIGAGEEGWLGRRYWTGASRPASCEKSERPCPAGSEAGAGATERGSLKEQHKEILPWPNHWAAPPHTSPSGGPRHPARGRREGNPHFPSLELFRSYRPDGRISPHP